MEITTTLSDIEKLINEKLEKLRKTRGNIKPNQNYNLNFTKTFTDLSKHIVIELITQVNTSLNTKIITSQILASNIKNEIKPIIINSLINKINQIRNNENYFEFLKTCSEFNLKNLKDYQTVADDCPEIINEINKKIKHKLSIGEENIICISYFLYLGMADSAKLIYILFCIEKYLLKHNLNLSLKKILFKIGINDMDCLSKCEKELTSKKIPISNLSTVFSNIISNITTNKKNKGGEIGCPFVLFEPKIVMNYIESLTNFYNKVYTVCYNENFIVNDYTDFKYMFKEFEINKKELLKFDFITEINK
jgi:hypothetical protein